MNTDCISTEEAAGELDVTPGRVRAMIRAGRLPAKSVGEGNRATYLIKRSDLELVRGRKPGRPPKDATIKPKEKKKRKNAK